MITLSRVETGSSDHCNGAKLAVKLVEERVKSDGEQAALYGGGIWQAMVALGDDVRAKHCARYGCGHHLRCIGAGRAIKAVEAAVQEALADSLKKIKAAEDKVAKQRKEFEQAAQELARKIRKDVRCPVAKCHALCVRSPAARGPCARGHPVPQSLVLAGGCDALCPRSL